VDLTRARLRPVRPRGTEGTWIKAPPRDVESSHEVELDFSQHRRRPLGRRPGPSATFPPSRPTLSGRCLRVVPSSRIYITERRSFVGAAPIPPTRFNPLQPASTRFNPLQSAFPIHRNPPPRPTHSPGLFSLSRDSRPLFKLVIQARYSSSLLKLIIPAPRRSSTSPAHNTSRIIIGSSNETTALPYLS
jgi:hypothetical protein